jgi:subtilisin-like proprotein convertase family protein
MVVNADFAGDAELFASAGTGKLYVLEMSTISGVVTDSGVGMDAIPVVATAAGPSAASAPGRDIPDNDQTGIEDTVELPNGGSVGPVVVGVNITHTWIGDLEVALIHPDGTTVLLHNRTGGSADNIVTTYPTLTPPAESLDVLKGKPIAGVWKLRVRDLGPADTGRLVSWSLTVERETPLVANAVTGPDGSYTLTDLEPGVWNVAPDNGHSTFLPAVQAVTIPSSKAGVDFALNSFTIGGKVTIGPDPVPNVLVTLTSPTDREINVSDSPGTPIPDNNTTGIEAPIVVSDLGTVTSVSVRVNITHPYIADLEVSLIHPDGTRLRLHNRTGGSADNIITTYPDQTRPAESLSALIGKPTKGTWKLRVRDLNIADVGTLNSWGLRIAFAGFADRTAATAPDGTYAFEDCIGGTHTVKPTSGWIRFNPAEAIVVVGPHQNDVDFVALATPTTLAVLPAQGERGGNVDLQAVLQETGGAPVVGQPVQFQVAGTVVGSGMTDATGTATVAFAIPVNMPVGDKDVAADFAGSDPYLPASAMGVLNVKGAKVLLFGPDRSGPIGSTVDLRAHLVTEVGRVPIPGKTITFEVNGTAVGQADTSAAGRATLPFVVPGPAGDYPIAFAFAGDADYEPGTAGATLTALIAPTTMTMPDRAGSIGGSSVDLRAFLYGPGSTVLPNKTVEFSVEGTAVGTAVTSTAGRALLMYPVPDGNGEGARAIGASYAGDVGYAPSSASATLNVARAPVYVWPFARSIKQGSAAALRAYVRRLYDYQWLPNRPIGFAVEGTYVGTANTDGAGVARFTYDGAAALAPGTYGFTASFAGDAWVAPGSGAATFRVVP